MRKKISNIYESICDNFRLKTRELQIYQTMKEKTNFGANTKGVIYFDPTNDPDFKRNVIIARQKIPMVK